MTLLLLAMAHAELPDGAAPAPAASPQETLEKGAASLDVSVRSLAIGALVRAEAEPCASPWTLRGMADPSVYVQRATLDGVDRPGGSPCTAELASWAASPNIDAHTRALAAVQLSAAASADIGAWAMALRSDGRAALFLYLAAVSGHTEAGARLDKLARSGNLPLEKEFYEALGFAAESAYAFPFADAFAAAEPEAQPWLAGAWFDHSPKQARATVRRLLHDRDEDRVFDTIEALLDDPNAIPLLRGVVGVDARLATTRFPLLAIRQIDADSLDRRLDSVRTLGRSPDARHRSLLRTRYAVEEDDTVRVAIARVLAERATAEDTAVLTAMLSDALLEIRVIAAAALLRG